MEHPRVKGVRAHEERLRKICMAYPEVVEAIQFGSPWWKAGKKSFCLYGMEDGRSGVAFNLHRDDQAALIEDPRFTKSRYIGRHGWTNLTLAGRVDWSEVADLVESAYRKVALKRMLEALDGH